jgi:hypothetical protein
MMVAVAVVALLMYGRRVQQYRLSLAVLCGIADRGVRHTGGIYRLNYDTATLWTVTPETPARTPAEIESRRRRSAYWTGLKQKYERAAARPWLLAGSDPLPPDS